jgi:hypothetical protein
VTPEFLAAQSVYNSLFEFRKSNSNPVFGKQLLTYNSLISIKESYDRYSTSNDKLADLKGFFLTLQIAIDKELKINITSNQNVNLQMVPTPTVLNSFLSGFKITFDLPYSEKLKLSITTYVYADVNQEAKVIVNNKFKNSMANVNASDATKLITQINTTSNMESY